MSRNSKSPMELRLGTSNRRVRVIAALDAATQVPDDDGLAARLQRFVDVARTELLAVPRAASGAGPLVGVSKPAQAGTIATFLLDLPELSAPALSALANVVRSTHGVTSARIESLDPEAADLRTQPTPFEGVTAAFDWTPVPKHRDVLKSGRLRVQFVSDLPSSAASSFEAAVSAWFSLVELGAFELGGDHPFSSGALVEASDAFPDEWVFAFEFLVADEHACRPLLRYLVGLHAAHSIVAADFSW